MNWMILYKKETRQIDQFVSNSFKMPTLADFGNYSKPEVHDYAQLVNPTFAISRDHKVIIEDGKVVDTEVNLNPHQPRLPEPSRDLKAEIAKLERRIKDLEDK